MLRSPFFPSPRSLLRRAAGGSSSGLTYFLLQALARVPDSLVLVRVGRAQGPYLRRRLSHLLPVGPAQDDMGLLFHAHRYPLWNFEFDRVRVAEREHQHFPFHFRAVTDAHNVQVLLESLSDSSDGVRKKPPRQPENSPQFFADAMDHQA